MLKIKEINPKRNLTEWTDTHLFDRGDLKELHRFFKSVEPMFTPVRMICGHRPLGDTDKSVRYTNER